MGFDKLSPNGEGTAREPFGLSLSKPFAYFLPAGRNHALTSVTCATSMPPPRKPPSQYIR